MNNILNEEDIEFLKELSNKLKTQDTLHTAKPVLFLVQSNDMIHGIVSDYEYNITGWYNPDNQKDFDSEDVYEEVCEIINDDEDLIKEYFIDVEEGIEITIEDIKNKFDEFDLNSFLEDKGYRKVYSRNNWVTKGSFLTREAAQNHIDANHYHYNKPRIYVDHAWRNIELEKLLQIVEKF